MAFSYREIEATTDGFRQELGRGAFGKVYKGELRDGRIIAVKVLDKVTQEELGEREFSTEMSVIDSRFLDWSICVQIAIGTTRGLLYLHEECQTQILHCDIKPQNILLDQNYNPKISDFSLAKLLRAEQTRTFTIARGTRGYIAPEWINSVPVTIEVDVYSFGIMLLEIICCRKTVKLDAPKNQIILVNWIYKCLERGSLVELVVQQQVEGVKIELRQLERMVLVGLWCIQEHPHLRPSISNMFQMMEGKVEIAIPQPPVPPLPVLPPLGSFSTSIST
ncbi:hypothetical protein SUGI_0018900 [Cryptomeria japonica]|nr:hypothetical protein SUGI_0018900 [Cryptomeria japonica]